MRHRQIDANSGCRSAVSLQGRLLSVAVGLQAVLIPGRALAQEVAAGPSDFSRVLSAALGIADWLCVGVIMYSGAAWMFGDRTRALQHLIGAATGYLIIRKATLIRDFLKGL